MSGLTRELRQGNHHFLWLVDHEQDWELYPVELYSAESTEHTYIQSPPLGLSPSWPPYAPPPQIERRLYFPGGSDVTVFGTFEVFVRPGVDLPDMVEFGFTEIIRHEILATTGIAISR